MILQMNTFHRTLSVLPGMSDQTDFADFVCRGSQEIFNVGNCYLSWVLNVKWINSVADIVLDSHIKTGFYIHLYAYLMQSNSIL